MSILFIFVIVLPIDKREKEKYTINENGSQNKEELFMADIIIIAVLVIVAFLVIRRQLHKMRSGSCCCGCSGSCSSCGETEKKQAK